MSSRSKGRISLVVAILVIVIIAGALTYRFIGERSTVTSSGTKSAVVISPPNPDTLVDIGTGGVITTPDALDPATGFYGVDGPVFSAVYQGLLTYNGSSITQLVPVLAKSWVMEPNGSTYVFIMRPGTYFSNGD
ncbi:MAG: hypothetical protein RXR41_00700, partial [Candidatus Marsarchaeota archaeon]